MAGLVLRCTAVTPIPDRTLAAAVTDLSYGLRDQQAAPERVLRLVPLDAADVADAVAFVARSAQFESVRDGRRRWAIVPAGGAR